MIERWRSTAARDLVRRVRRAGGTVERVGKGRLKVTGPTGSVRIAEPGEPSRRDLRRVEADRLIEQKTGLNLTGGPSTD